MAAPIRKGTLFRRMRSVASTGVVIGTTLMRYARIRAMASPTAEVRIPSRDADRRSLAERVLTPEAQTFIARLNREVAETRAGLLEARQERWADLRSGGTLRFPEETATVRAADWRVAKAPRDLQVRKVEITGPTDRKMVINALNSGRSLHMAESEDANTPTWLNLIEGQQNLSDAIDRTIEFRNPDGKVYKLGRQTATLVVRPRGWHLEEKHFLVDGMPTIGAIFDFGLYMFRNAKLLLDRGTGPYFYLPKMESYREARLWNEIFQWTEHELQIPRGSIRATVLVEVITLAFEMDEVLYELRDYSGGLNAGRWDYMFSIIKKFAGRPEFILPDRAQVTMTVPFMREYTELLVKTCHRRGAFALGGMAAFIPNRRDPTVTEAALAKVRDDKVREANDGFDGDTRPRQEDRAGRAWEDPQGRRRRVLRRRSVRGSRIALRRCRAFTRLRRVPHAARIRATRLASGRSAPQGCGSLPRDSPFH